MEKREAYCHLVASIMASDGIIAPAERHFLNEAMTHWNLTPQERERVIHFEHSDEALALASQLPEDERRLWLDDLVAAALADGRLSQHETMLIEKITAALALPD